MNHDIMKTKREPTENLGTNVPLGFTVIALVVLFLVTAGSGTVSKNHNLYQHRTARTW